MAVTIEVLRDMKVSNITDYLIKLEREKFTGQIRLNFHKGDVAVKVEKKERVLMCDEEIE